ncbi:SMP-30/gluconolactonase/LRE family protein [soil metagenome]
MPASEIRLVLDVPMQLGECPIWSAAEGVLYWIDIGGMAVHRFAPDGATHRAWSLPSEPGCIALCREGGLLVAMRSGFALLDPASGALTILADAPYDVTKMRFNDGRCDAAGRLWVGTLYEPRDKASGPLYCVERGVVRDSGLRSIVSNGVAFSTDGRTLYHAETSAHNISAYDFDLDSGTVSNGRIFHQFSMDRSGGKYGGRPDGAAVDSENAYWCAMYEGGRLLRFSSTGELLLEIALPVQCPTMIAFGGADLCTLYVTSARRNRSAEELERLPHSGCLLSLRVDVPGLPEPLYIR